jgi:hypothetical protein
MGFGPGCSTVSVLVAAAAAAAVGFAFNILFFSCCLYCLSSDRYHFCICDH